METKENFV